jgi:outer membrane protein assembly factor BamB
VYCLEAATGRIVWESTLGSETERAERVRADCRRQLVLPNTTLNRDFCSAPAVAGGVVVCNNNAGGLIGLDAATGARAWLPVTNCITKVGSPVRWTCEGSNYVIAASERAVCVDPATGRLLWQTTNGVANEGTVAVNEDYLVTGGGGRNSTGISCFRIGRTYVIRHWSIGPKWNCHVTSPVIYNGHAYGFGGGPAVCVELMTGKIAGTADFYSVRSCSSFVAADGRIVRPHLYNKLILYDANPTNFRQLGDLWTAPSYAECTTPAIADGRMFFRGKDCVYCYDLRAMVAR